MKKHFAHNSGENVLLTLETNLFEHKSVLGGSCISENCNPTFRTIFNQSIPWYVPRRNHLPGPALSGRSHQETNHIIAKYSFALLKQFLIPTIKC